MTRGSRIKNTFLLIAGLIMILHLIMPHYHHFSYDDCTSIINECENLDNNLNSHINHDSDNNQDSDGDHHTYCHALNDPIVVEENIYLPSLKIISLDVLDFTLTTNILFCLQKTESNLTNFYIKNDLFLDSFLISFYPFRGPPFC